MLSKSKICKKYFRLLGNSVTLVTADGGEKQFFAAIQQTWRKNKTRFEALESKLGQVHNDYYLYLGPADVDITTLSRRDILRCNGNEYYFVVTDSVSVGDRVQYYTGVLKRIYKEDGNVFN
ncbi:MAG: hypothetical protein ACI4IG_06920 [Eubacterium sp.]